MEVGERGGNGDFCNSANNKKEKNKVTCSLTSLVEFEVSILWYILRTIKQSKTKQNWVTNSECITKTNCKVYHLNIYIITEKL